MISKRCYCYRDGVVLCGVLLQWRRDDEMMLRLWAFLGFVTRGHLLDIMLPPSGPQLVCHLAVGSIWKLLEFDTTKKE